MASHSDINDVQQQGEVSVETDAETVDWKDLIAEMDSHFQRLGWTVDQARDHVVTTYGKHSRLLRGDTQLFELLDYLRELVSAQE